MKENIRFEWGVHAQVPWRGGKLVTNRPIPDALEIFAKDAKGNVEDLKGVIELLKLAERCNGQSETIWANDGQYARVPLFFGEAECFDRFCEGLTNNANAKIQAYRLKVALPWNGSGNHHWECSVDEACAMLAHGVGEYGNDLRLSYVMSEAQKRKLKLEIVQTTPGKMIDVVFSIQTMEEMEEMEEFVQFCTELKG